MRWSAVASQIAIAAQSATAPVASPAPPAPAVPVVARVPTASLRGEAYAGYAGSIALGGDFLVRYRLFESGALCQELAFNLITSNFGCAVAAGISPRSRTYSRTWGVGADLLGVFGARHWKGVGHTGFLDPDPGGSATLPFAGLRAGASFYLDPFVFSIWLGVDDDLGRAHVTYTYDKRTEGAADVGAVTWIAAWRTGLQYDVP